MSEATARLVRRVFLTEDRGEIGLKGIDHPVRVFALTGERRRQSRFDALLERGLTPFVGRERELVFLDDCLARAREGRGRGGVVGRRSRGRKIAPGLRARPPCRVGGRRRAQGGVSAARRSGAVPRRRGAAVRDPASRRERSGSLARRDAAGRRRTARSGPHLGGAVCQAAARAASPGARGRRPRPSAAQAAHARGGESAGAPQCGRTAAASARRRPAMDRPQLGRGAPRPGRRARRPTLSSAFVRIARATRLPGRTEASISGWRSSSSPPMRRAWPRRCCRIGGAPAPRGWWPREPRATRSSWRSSRFCASKVPGAHHGRRPETIHDLPGASIISPRPRSASCSWPCARPRIPPAASRSCEPGRRGCAGR